MSMTTPLNSQPVLDHGHIACLSTSNDGRALSNLQRSYLGDSINAKLLHIANATFIIKMPLFVQINISQYDFNTISTKNQTKIQTYIPDVADIGCAKVEDGQKIHDYLEATTEAVILNSKALPMDGCNEFVAQTQMPISIYNEVIIHGSLYNWLQYIKQKNLPRPLEAYRFQVEEILRANWKNLTQLKKMV